MLQGVQAKNQRERPGGAEVVSLGEARGRVACRRLSKNQTRAPEQDRYRRKKVKMRKRLIKLL